MVGKFFMCPLLDSSPPLLGNWATKGEWVGLDLFTKHSTPYIITSALVMAVFLAQVKGTEQNHNLNLNSSP